MSGTKWTEILNAKYFLNTDEKVYIHDLNTSNNGEIIYALASIKYYEQGILLISKDSGNSWVKSDSVVDGKGACMTLNLDNPQNLYIGTWYRGVYRSDDGGKTWIAINNGLPSNWENISTIAIDPVDTNTIYLAIETKIYKSTDKGNNWEQLGYKIDPGDPCPGYSDASITDIRISSLNRDVYALVWTKGLYKLVHEKKDFSLSDCVIALQVLSGLKLLPTINEFDVDHDGKIWMKDVIYILQKVKETEDL